jgi:hypothetical protein
MQTFKEIILERVKPSPETRAKLVKPLDRKFAASLKLKLKIAVDELDALAWDLENRVDGIDANAIKELKAVYKHGKAMEKQLKAAIDKAKV